MTTSAALTLLATTSLIALVVALATGGDPDEWAAPEHLFDTLAGPAGGTDRGRGGTPPLPAAAPPPLPGRDQ